MSFDTYLERYAELMVSHGLNVQRGQVVNISTEVCNRAIAMLVARAAYKRGARHVNVDLGDPLLGRIRIEESTEEDLQYVPNFLSVKYKDLVDDAAANLKIIGSENPDILSDLDPKKVNTVRLHQHLAVKYFYDEGIGKSKVHWTVAAAATPAWGQKVFPETAPKEAERRLWDEIFKICRVDKEDCMALWKEHNELLRSRASKLTEMKIKEVHFQGPGTDLTVGLSEKAIFKGGSDMGPHGVEYEPNLPTEEVFTTPNCRLTQGKARATRPFFINGKLIEDLQLEFNDGRITNFSASQGEDTFREYISSDKTADLLGEVALVGIDSPVFESGLVFQEILFDENAACHIAVGSAYKFCIDGGDTMSEEELKAIGCNDSSVHTDMMISSEEVDVTARLYSGEEVELIKAGCWTI